MVVGYVRVSTVMQNNDRQMEALKDCDKLYIEKKSGKNVDDRLELKKMLEYVREGDTIIVLSIDRLARNLIDLTNIVQTLQTKKVCIKFIKEGLSFNCEENNHINTLMLNMMGAFAQFEREVIKERQREGIEIAKKEGKFQGRKNSLNDTQIETIKDKLNLGISISRIAEDMNLCRQTIAKYIKDNKLKAS